MDDVLVLLGKGRVWAATQVPTFRNYWLGPPAGQSSEIQLLTHKVCPRSKPVANPAAEDRSSERLHNAALYRAVRADSRSGLSTGPDESFNSLFLPM